MSRPRLNDGHNNIDTKLLFDMFFLFYVAIRGFLLSSTKLNKLPWHFKINDVGKVKTEGYIWGLNFNWWVCALVRDNQAIFGRDIIEYRP